MCVCVCTCTRTCVSAPSGWTVSRDGNVLHLQDAACCPYLSPCSCKKLGTTFLGVHDVSKKRNIANMGGLSSLYFIATHAFPELLCLENRGYDPSSLRRTADAAEPRHPRDSQTGLQSSCLPACKALQCQPHPSRQEKEPPVLTEAYKTLSRSHPVPPGLLAAVEQSWSQHRG